MGIDQYHEPANESPEAPRTFARMIASLTEEAEAITWYQQRLALEKDPGLTRSCTKRSRMSTSISRWPSSSTS